MKLIPIEVQCYAGHKADEHPTRFRVEHEWIEVKGIIDRWYQGERDPEWPMADYFKILGEGEREYLLRHDRESGEWALVGA